MRPVVVGIAGASGSGKTTLAQALVGALGDRALLIHHDRYYHDVAHPPSFNYDVPEAYETELLLQHVSALSAGQRVGLPVYQFATHSRRPEVEEVAPRPVILVEGILVLAEARLRQLMHLKVYVDTPIDLCLARRVQRDVVSRGRDAGEVIGRYLRDVRPAFLRHIQPSRALADVVVDGTDDVQALVDAIAQRLEPQP